MKKKFYFVFILLCFFTFNCLVYASGDEEDKVNVSIDDGDYELVCIYSDGAELTITRDEIYIINTSDQSAVNSSTYSNVSFYLDKDQLPTFDSEGKLTKTNFSKILDDGRCPAQLYLYMVDSTQDNTNKSNKKEETEENVGIEGVFNYYYATKSGLTISTIETGILFWKKEVSNAIEVTGSIYLKSERVYLTTDKEATICDYKSVGDDGLPGNSGTIVASLYIYDNRTFLERGGIVTIVGKRSDCPQKLTDKQLEQVQKGEAVDKYIYINDPSPKAIGDELSGRYKYNYKRFYWTDTSSGIAVCKDAYNNGKECDKFQFFGVRNGPPDDSSVLDVCDILGNKSIEVLQEIVRVLQVVVPAIVIVLIGIDITKMVLAGNLDEELPKKKKSIIIRLIVMLVFFFAPTIVRLIIKLINDTGIVQIDNLECFFNGL